MNESKHQASLRGTALWCLSRYEGILTPTGKKKKAPDFWILKCLKCRELSLTSTKAAKAKRFQCQVQKPSPTKTKNPSRPYTLVCEGDTTIIEEISP